MPMWAYREVGGVYARFPCSCWNPFVHGSQGDDLLAGREPEGNHSSQRWRAFRQEDATDRDTRLSRV